MEDFDRRNGSETDGLLSPEGEPGGHKIGRREFLVGGAGATLALIGATAILSGCSSGSDGSGDGEDGIDPEELEVSEDQVVNSADFTEIPMGDCVVETASIDLPMGSIAFMDCDDIVAVLFPGYTPNVLVQIGLLSLSSATLTTVVPYAVGRKEGFQLYDVRCNDKVIIWVETNAYTDDWRVYMAPVVSSAEIGEPVLVDEGDVDFDPPMLAVCGQKAFWTVMPFEEGSASDSDSYLKSASMASRTPAIEYTSHGRMITNPEVSGNVITIVPRAETRTARYQMTALDAMTGKVLAAQRLPSSMRVNDAIYMDGEFVFGIEQTYNFGGGIARFGTYTNIGDDTYMRFSRTPMDTPARVGKYLVIKSTKSVCGVDTAQRSYFAIDTVPNCESYGDFLLSTGESEQIVTYTTVPLGDGSGIGLVRVRAFSVL